MSEVHTDPEIIRAIGESLRNFNKHGEYERYISSVPPPNIRRCVEDQAKIGWTGFLEGLISQEWSIQQTRYYRFQQSRRSGHRWAIELSKRVWKLVFSMWDHCNRILFETDKADKMSGLGQLKAAINREILLGSQDLDEAFHPYLTVTTDTFTKMKPISLRRWFSMI